MRHPFVRAVSAAALLVLLGSPALADLAAATDSYATLLERYATSRGVRYAAWRASGSDLKSISEIVMQFRNTDPTPLPPDERKALYINLYNAEILELVVQSNLKSSIKELSKTAHPLEIFNRGILSFDRKAISLNDLEKRLRDEFKDPRALFALSRASKSSPPVRREPYLAATLDAQLDDAARAFLASPDAIQVLRAGGKATIVAAKIFDVYADDFKASGGALAFIRTFGPQDAADAIAGGKVKLEFTDYDWSLNAAK
jgi:hypothetical protein